MKPGKEIAGMWLMEWSRACLLEELTVIACAFGGEFLRPIRLLILSCHPPPEAWIWLLAPGTTGTATGILGPDGICAAAAAAAAKEMGFGGAIGARTLAAAGAGSLTVGFGGGNDT